MLRLFRNKKDGTTKNARQMPARYFGMHFEPGVAEYREPNEKGEEEVLRIFINEQVAKEMDPTFEAKPVYVDHVEGVDVENLQNEAAGYVVKSFYNELDGKHWAEFLVVSDLGHEAIRRHFRLSNAYVPTAYGEGGQWHGVDYQKSVKRAEYEHLALVQNPRYEGSVILTPEEYKAYCDKKKSELSKVANSKQTKKECTVLFNWLKKTKFENELAEQMEAAVVELPKSKQERTIAQLVNEADSRALKNGYADGSAMVKCGNEEMSVDNVVGKYLELKKNEEDRMKKEADEKAKNKKKKNEEPEYEESEADIEEADVAGGDIENDESAKDHGEGLENEDDDEDEDQHGDAKHRNVDDTDEDYDSNEGEKDKKVAKKNKSKKNSDHFDRIANAHTRHQNRLPEVSTDTSLDQLQRGANRYG